MGHSGLEATHTRKSGEPSRAHRRPIGPLVATLPGRPAAPANPYEVCSGLHSRRDKKGTVWGQWQRLIRNQQVRGSNPRVGSLVSSTYGDWSGKVPDHGSVTVPRNGGHWNLQGLLLARQHQPVALHHDRAGFVLHGRSDSVAGPRRAQLANATAATTDVATTERRIMQRSLR